MKKLLISITLVTVLGSANCAAAGNNTFGLGFGGLYGDFGIKLDHSLTERLSIGVLQSWQASATFTHIRAKYLFNAEPGSSSPFITYGLGGIANEQYADLQGTVAGIGYRSFKAESNAYSEFSISTIISVDAPYYFTTAPLYIGFSYGKNF